MPLHQRNQKKLRTFVLARDGNVCQLRIPGVCRSRGKPLPDDQMHVDHDVESRAGGNDSLRNLQAACKWCNEHKSGGKNHHINGKVKLI